MNSFSKRLSVLSAAGLALSCGLAQASSLPPQAYPGPLVGQSAPQATDDRASPSKDWDGIVELPATQAYPGPRSDENLTSASRRAPDFRELPAPQAYPGPALGSPS
jgi:hypothetical protein